LNLLNKLKDYSVGYKTSDIGLKDCYSNTDRFSLHLGIVE